MKKMTKITLILTLVLLALTIIEGAYIKDYPAMFATGLGALYFLGVLIILVSIEQGRRSK